MSTVVKRKRDASASAPAPVRAPQPETSEKPVYTPQYSMKIDIGRKILHLNVRLPKVPPALIVCDAHSTRFTLSTPRFPRNYVLDIPYLHGLTIAPKSAEANFEEENLHIKAEIKTISPEAEAAETEKRDAIVRESKLRFVTKPDGSRAVHERKPRAKKEEPVAPAARTTRLQKRERVEAKRAEAAATATAAPPAKRTPPAPAAAPAKAPKVQNNPSRKSFLSDDRTTALDVIDKATAASAVAVRAKIDAMQNSQEAAVRRTTVKAERKTAGAEKRAALAAARMSGKQDLEAEPDRVWGNKKKKRVRWNHYSRLDWMNAWYGCDQYCLYAALHNPPIVHRCIDNRVSAHPSPVAQSLLLACVTPHVNHVYTVPCVLAMYPTPPR